MKETYSWDKMALLSEVPTENTWNVSKPFSPPGMTMRVSKEVEAHRIYKRSHMEPHAFVLGRTWCFRENVCVFLCLWLASVAQRIVGAVHGAY